VLQYLKRKYNLLVGERTAEQIKMEIGSAYPLEKPLTMEVKGGSARKRGCRYPSRMIRWHRWCLARARC
jgi:actin-like ATPase involved in cell morphogenesis